MELNTLPMWSERQVVRLRQAEAASEDLLQALVRYLENPAPSAALLVEFTGDLNPKRRTSRRLEDPARENEPSGRAHPGSGREYIIRRLRAEGFAMAPEASAALDEWACGDMGRLVSALDLLCLYQARREKRIAAEDLDALLGTGGTPKEWDLQDAFLNGRQEGLSRSSSSKIAAGPGFGAPHVRGHALQAAPLPPAPARARGPRASQKDILPKELGFNHPFPAQKLLAVAGKWPERRVRLALGALFELDLALKGDPGPPWSIVERHLLKLMPAEAPCEPASEH